MLKIILLSINVVVASLLTGVVLLQKSEGGALGMGGGPSNFMSARGTGDLLTRITWILFSLFLGISITLTLISASERKPGLGRDLQVAPADAIKAQSANTPQPTSPDDAPPALNLQQLPAAPAGALAPTDTAPAEKK
jgi:preprotein translocase subunit SecG